MEQPYPVTRFKRLDAAIHGAVVRANQICGGPEAPGAGDGKEVGQLLPVKCVYQILLYLRNNAFHLLHIINLRSLVSIT